MDKQLEHLFITWKHPIITTADIAVVLGENPSRYHSIINRLLKKGVLIKLKRGFYLIANPYNQNVPDTFAIAPLLYGPSYISFESALSYNGWIPETIYSTTSACTKRQKQYNTSIGIFHYRHTPLNSFYYGVERVVENNSSFFIASPWKALADLIYSKKRSWQNIQALKSDLRIEQEEIENSDLQLLQSLCKNYGSRRVKTCLKKILTNLLP